MLSTATESEFRSGSSPRRARKDCSQDDNVIAALCETLSQRTQLSHPHISDPESWAIINVYCFKLLSLGVICFVATGN